MVKVYQSVIGVMLVSLLAGCGKPQPAIVPAGGVVRLDGKPLQRVAVRFFPVNQEGQDYVATDVTDKTGHYQLTCNGQPGACAGVNRVVVMEDDLPRQLQSENAQLEMQSYYRSLGGRPLPQKYSNLVQTTLKVTVTADQAEYALDLRR